MDRCLHGIDIRNHCQECNEALRLDEERREKQRALYEAWQLSRDRVIEEAVITSAGGAGWAGALRDMEDAIREMKRAEAAWTRSQVAEAVALDRSLDDLGAPPATAPITLSPEMVQGLGLGLKSIVQPLADSALWVRQFSEDFALGKIKAFALATVPVEVAGQYSRMVRRVVAQSPGDPHPATRDDMRALRDGIATFERSIEKIEALVPEGDG